MNQDAIREWIDLHRSGDYEQGFRKGLQFKGNDGHVLVSSLGLLCILAYKHGICSKEKDSQGYTHFDGEYFYLPESVMQWIGFDDPDPIVNTPWGEKSLTELNDGQTNFETIADAIERTFCTGTS